MKSRRAMFLVQMGWLIFLGTLALVRIIAPPSKIGLPDMIGSLPIAVVWFGAMGAVLISLTGIVEHAKDWDVSFVLWHLSRPLMGGSLAIVAVLIMQAGILAVGTTLAGAQPSTPKYILYYLVAFLVGYREETFREMIKRLVDLIFTPATPKPKTDEKQPAAAGGIGPDKLPIAAKEKSKDDKETPVVPPPSKPADPIVP
ncbi:MAG TPA: hypothetical protein VGQ46_07310 [Thermoanaerobaculia bacterium]|jgi:hypothetical protein|nr:hypothetical protein [Thermoanaerobaculia bacterium]